MEVLWRHKCFRIQDRKVHCELEVKNSKLKTLELIWRIKMIERRLILTKDATPANIVTSLSTNIYTRSLFKLQEKNPGYFPAFPVKNYIFPN